MPVTRNQSSAAANGKPTNDTTDSASKENIERGETSADNDPPRRDSPENCSICLGPFNNKSFTSSCAHSFCYVCLKQWSKVKAECPLCKQPFTSIFYNIRSNDNYDIYELPPFNPPRPIDYNFYNYVGGNLTTFPPAHQYFNFSQPTLDADLTLSNFSRFQFRHRRYDRFLNLHQHPVHGEHQYSYTSSSVTPSTHVCAASWPRGAEDFRRHVYRHHMGPPALILGSENSTYRLTPAMVAASAHRLHRIMPWLTRELRVLLRSHQNVRLAISIIQPLLTQVTIDSYYFSEKVSPLIGQKSRLFIQEFVAFANSALTLQAFDRKAMYLRRVVCYDEDSSTSSGDDEVVEVSDVSPETQTLSSGHASVPNAVNLQRTGWNSPTPGPSWESPDLHSQIDVDRVSVSSESDDPVFRPDLNGSDSDNSKPGSDIVFVKYDKPWNERSPIQLSSDTEGDGRSRKKKKSKHKKRRKESSDIILRKRGKAHKSLKSRSKEKYREKLKGSSGEEFQQESESSPSNKRPHSVSSSDRQKKKKHKRAKDKCDLTTGHSKDRELVDRLFAEAFTLQQNTNTASGSGDTEIPSSSKPKDSHRKGKSCDREKIKKKKKKRNISRSSTSPSELPSYKKHHSGHKKSDPNSRNKELERRKIQNRHLPREDGPSEHTSQSGSFERELHPSRNPPTPRSNLGHSITSTFQTSYLPMPDTVQHIPLNLWVSTWPSLPVSHTFTPPPSSSFPPPHLPHVASSSALTLHGLNHPQREQNSSALDSQTISSESSSDSDSDGSPDIRSLPDRGRTKQWLEANFPSIDKQPSISSLAKAELPASNVTKNWGIDSLLSKDLSTNSIEKKSDHISDIVSIGSGDDEDIVVCSSVSSEKSDFDEVSVIETTNCILDVNEIIGQSSSYRLDESTGEVNTMLRQGEGANVQGTSRNSLSQTSGIFQPFKLQRKSKLAKPKLDALFSNLAASSDEDTSKSPSLKSPGPTQMNANNFVPSSTQVIPKPLFLDQECSTNGKAVSKENHALNINKTYSFDNVGNILESSPIVDYNAPISSSKISEEQRPTVTSTFPAVSSSANSIFGVLPTLQTPSIPVTSMLPTNLGYLPYSSLPVPSSLSSILPQSLPFVVPAPPPPPPPLPHHFPFPPIPPLLHPPPSSLFPPVYPAYSQSDQVAATSCSVFTTTRDPKLSYTLLTKSSSVVDPENAGETLDSSLLSNSTITTNAQSISTLHGSGMDNDRRSSSYIETVALHNDSSATPVNTFLSNQDSFNCPGENAENISLAYNKNTSPGPNNGLQNSVQNPESPCRTQAYGNSLHPSDIESDDNIVCSGQHVNVETARCLGEKTNEELLEQGLISEKPNDSLPVLKK